jgi:preprotein translocase subunit SecA
VLVGRGDAVAQVLEELAGESEEASLLLAKKEEELGPDNFLAVARTIMLQTLDMLWVDHLESMEYLRGSVNLRAYGQRDPLIEYRKEGTQMFKMMEQEFKGRVFELLEKLAPAPEGAPQGLAAAQQVIPAGAGQMAQGQATAGEELGRNDPCPCGSGKKWKNCGLKNTEEHQKLIAGKK